MNRQVDELVVCDPKENFWTSRSAKKTDKIDAVKLARLLRKTVLLGDIILTEILQGFDSDKDFRLVRQALEPLNCVHLGGKSMAIIVTSNFCFFRLKGITIKKKSRLFIGSWCIEHEVELLHNDKDFDHIAIQLPLQIYVI